MALRDVDRYGQVMGRKRDKTRSNRGELLELRLDIDRGYARAMKAAQRLEEALLVIAISIGTASTAEALEADAMDLAKKPIERLRKAVDQRFGGDLGQLERDLERAKRIRNFLAHNYFRERESVALTHEGCVHMLDELHRCVAFLCRVEEHLMDKFEEQVMQFGGRELTEEAEKQLESLLMPDREGFGKPVPGLPEPGTVPGMY